MSDIFLTLRVPTIALLLFQTIALLASFLMPTALVAGLFFAGHETTVNLLGNGLYHLLSNQDQFEKLMNNPNLLPQAVNEMLRYDSPVQFTARFAANELRIGDHLIKANSLVRCCLGSANRDPEIFTAPEIFDIERKSKPLSFGGSIHVCLGMHLAKLEAEVVFKLLLERFPGISFTDQKPMRRTTISLRGFDSLPVKV